MRPAAVIDTSSLIALLHLELAEKLVLFFDRVYVPSAVRREVARKRRMRYRVGRLLTRPPFERCEAADRTSVEMLLPQLGAGEAEALIQAQEKGASTFLADEPRARHLALGYGLKPYGTLGLLARLQLEGIVEDARALVAKLRRDLKFRISSRLVDEELERIL